MPTINRTSRFKKDYKRELKGRHGATFEKEFQHLLLQLLSDAPLKEKYRDHPLTGDGKITAIFTLSLIWF